jgi:SAM-dependent methyltransferase
MIDALRRWLQREAFDPTWCGVFVNPSFFTRRGLRDGIRKHAERFRGRMVDFGCGRKPYRGLFKVDEYVGVDVEVSGHPDQDKHVDLFYRGNVIPLPDESVDGILSSEVFEHVFDLELILPELNRILRPGGVMLVTCPFCWNEHETPYDYARYTRFALRHRLEKAGFRVIEEEKEGHFIHALAQMAVVYFTLHLTPGAPFLGWIFRIGWSTCFNSLGIALGLVLPRRWDFYLSNVFLVEKPGSSCEERHELGSRSIALTG